MKLLVVALVILVGVTSAGTQPVDGDLVVGLRRAGFGFVLYATPGSRVLTTLVVAPTGVAFYDVQMDTNNVDMIMGVDDGSRPVSSSRVLRLNPLGRLTTLGTVPGVVPGITNVELDHDGVWVLAGYDINTPQTDWLWSLPASGGAVTTLFGMPNGGNPMLDFTVDRDPGSWPYVVMRGTLPSPAPWMQSADRTGILSTIAVAPPIWPKPGGIAFDPRLGDYLVASVNVLRMTKRGSFTTINATIQDAGAVAIQQDGTAWIGTLEYLNNVPAPILYRIDPQGVVLSRIRFPGLIFHWFSGIAVYGERRLVCSGSGKPGTPVSIRLQCRRPGDAGKPYALGCSLARRPGIPVPGGNAIDLNPQSLLFLSASGLAPGIFQNFQGQTDAMGNATATVHLPSALPPKLGIPIFVAGVVYDATGIRTITNTHWFVLN